MNTNKKLLFGLVIGIISVRWWPWVPEIWPAIFLLLFLVFNRKRIPIFIVGLSLGGFLSLSAVSLYKYQQNIAFSIDKDTTIAGKVGSLYSENKRFKRIIFDIDTKEGQKISGFGFRISLFSDQKWVFKEGQRWQLKVRLREPYGRLNAAGFDAETYYLANHIHAKGTLLSAKLLDDQVSLRQQWFDRLQPVFSQYAQGRFILALAFGERGQLTDSDWQLLQQTGLSHLLAISGLHIGLAYGFAFAVCVFLRPCLMRRDIFLMAPYLFGVLVAVLYAWTAGFSLPTQRAVIGLSLWVMIRLSGFQCSRTDTFLMVFACVLVSDPFSVFSVSLWLSFGAVGLILFSQAFVMFQPKLQTAVVPRAQASSHLFSQWFHRLFRPIKRYAMILLVLQSFLLLGMLPLNAYFFGGFSLSSLLANFIALPIVSFITVPSILVGLLLSFYSADHVFWQLADVSLLWVMGFAELVDNAWFRMAHVSPFFWLVLFAGFLLLMLTEGRKQRLMVFIWVLIVLSWKDHNQLAPKSWRMDVLDVGHGLAILLTQGDEAVLYDTGGAWNEASIAKSVIAPILEQQNLQLKGLILSHFDNDHAGGMDWITQNLSPQWIRSSSNQYQHLPCQQGETWHWQHLTFSVIAPNALSSRPKNAHSCVIQVQDGTHQILLTGDLPAQEEKRMIDEGFKLKSDILLVPHHGSYSSSSSSFLQAVDPQLAIASTGRYTPWRLPHPSIKNRYQQMDIDWMETRTDGQISVIFSEKGWKVMRYRQDIEPYWYRKVVGAI